MDKCLLRCTWLSLCLLLLVSCAAPSNGLFRRFSTSAGEQVIEDEGVVCFSPFDNTVEVRGYYAPSGCFSSSCTRPIEESLTVRVDTDASRIQFDTRFVLTQPYDPVVHGCTLDCDGAGSIQFEIGDIERGTYSVWIGREKLGEIDVPSRVPSGRDICLESKQGQTAMPSLVPRPSTRPTVTPPPVGTSVHISPISPLSAPTRTPTFPPP
jgi:hypothetical protein